jgi:hypothetical protein
MLKERINWCDWTDSVGCRFDKPCLGLTDKEE